VPFFLNGHNAWVEGVGENHDAHFFAIGADLLVKPFEGLKPPEFLALRL
jgi:4-diphosphocytidyl-2C-methyl-D-erythritol kinase